MKAEDLERTYQETTFGFDEPEVAYLYGDTLLDLLGKVGDRRRRTNDGKAIQPERYYELSRAGIFEVT